MSIFYTVNYCAYTCATLSLLGSCWVLISILTNREPQKARILSDYVLWISVCDLVLSMSISVNCWPPFIHQTPDVIYAILRPEYDPSNRDHVYFFALPYFGKHQDTFMKTQLFLTMFFWSVGFTFWVQICFHLHHIIRKPQDYKVSKVQRHVLSWGVATAITAMYFFATTMKSHHYSTAGNWDQWMVIEFSGPAWPFLLHGSGILSCMLYGAYLAFITWYYGQYLRNRMRIFVGFSVIIWIPLFIIFNVGMSGTTVIIFSCAGFCNSLVWTTSSRFVSVFTTLTTPRSRPISLPMNRWPSMTETLLSSAEMSILEDENIGRPALLTHPSETPSHVEFTPGADDSKFPIAKLKKQSVLNKSSFLRPVLRTYPSETPSYVEFTPGPDDAKLSLGKKESTLNANPCLTLDEV